MVTDEQKKTENGQKRMEAKLRIQALYEAVSQDSGGTDEQWQKLVEELKAYSRPIVQSVLDKSPFRSKMDFEEVMSMVWMDFFGKNISGNYRKSLEKRPDGMFADYFCGACSNKAKDYIGRNKKEILVEDPGLQQPGSGKASVPKRHPGRVQIPDIPLEEADVTERFIQYYLEGGLCSKANPFHIIFWCYSKILPVILFETNCTSADTWAWEQMLDRTMTELSDHFRRIFNNTMRVVRMEWSRQYIEQLDEPYKATHKQGETVQELSNGNGNEGTIRLGDVVLTDEFTQKNAKNWVSRMHERAIKKAVTAILRSGDEEVIEMAMCYTRGKLHI